MEEEVGRREGKVAEGQAGRWQAGEYERLTREHSGAASRQVDECRR